MCGWDSFRESHFGNLDSDPPLELRGEVHNEVHGFFLKYDSGNIGVWGHGSFSTLTEWTVLGGPVIGFHYFEF